MRLLTTILLALSACGQRALPDRQDAQGAASSVALDSGTAQDSFQLLGDGAMLGDPATWSCTIKPDGRVFCKKVDDTGLPPGTGWICHLGRRQSQPVWFCQGELTWPLSSLDWMCLGVVRFRCERPDGPADRPPGPGPWVCVKGSIYGGTVCEKVNQTRIPSPGTACITGQRMWCDGVDAGWGLAECDPATGTWRTKVSGGKQMIDCRVAADGRVPLTGCACHHFFFNLTCCERVDCIVPDEVSGQICLQSVGTLCDPCNPLQDQCVEPGAECIVTSAGETFCGRVCTDGSSISCPPFFGCLAVKHGQKTVIQCVPSDLSCYY